MPSRFNSYLVLTSYAQLGLCREYTETYDWVLLLRSLKQVGL